MKPTATLLLLIVFGLAPDTTSAHRAHFGWSDVVWKNGTLEITHRVHEHDAASLLSQIDRTDVDITSLKAQARFALYVAEHFQVYEDGELLEPTLIGASLENKYLLVFQELTVSRSAEDLAFDSDILMNLFDDQVHLINVRWQDQQQTLEFNQQTGPTTAFNSGLSH